MYVNLLPTSLNQQLVVRRCLRQWAPLWGSVVVGLVGFLGFSLWELSSDEAEIVAIEERQSDWSQMQQEAVDFLRRVSVSDKERSVWKAAEEGTVILQLFTVLSQSVEKARGEIQVQHCQISSAGDVPAPPPSAGIGPQPAPKPVSAADSAARNITLTGVALTDLSLMDFVAALKEIGKFKHVEIKSLAASPLGKGLREWRLECSL